VNTRGFGHLDRKNSEEKCVRLRSRLSEIPGLHPDDVERKVGDVNVARLMTARRSAWIWQTAVRNLAATPVGSALFDLTADEVSLLEGEVPD
jgi:hypothetical protein